LRQKQQQKQLNSSKIFHEPVELEQDLLVLIFHCPELFAIRDLAEDRLHSGTITFQNLLLQNLVQHIEYHSIQVYTLSKIWSQRRKGRGKEVKRRIEETSIQIRYEIERGNIDLGIRIIDLLCKLVSYARNQEKYLHNKKVQKFFQHRK